MLKKNHRPWLMFTVDPAPDSGATTPDPPAQPAPTVEPAAAPEPPAPEGATPELKPNDKKILTELQDERTKRKALEKGIREILGMPDMPGKDAPDALAARIAALEDKATRAETELRTQIAQDVPEDLREFLTADTVEGLRSQAAKLKAVKASSGPQGPAPDPAQGAKPGQTTAQEYDAAIAEATKAGNHAESIRLKRQRAALGS